MAILLDLFLAYKYNMCNRQYLLSSLNLKNYFRNYLLIHIQFFNFRKS